MIILQEILDKIENQHKSKIKLVNIFCEVDTSIAKFYLEFCLENGDYDDVCIHELQGENFTCNDVNVVLPYNDVVRNYTKALTNDYNIPCQSQGIYDNRILKNILKNILNN